LRLSISQNTWIDWFIIFYHFSFLLHAVTRWIDDITRSRISRRSPLHFLSNSHHFSSLPHRHSSFSPSEPYILSSFSSGRHIHAISSTYFRSFLRLRQRLFRYFNIITDSFLSSFSSSELNRISMLSYLSRIDWLRFPSGLLNIFSSSRFLPFTEYADADVSFSFFLLLSFAMPLRAWL